MPLTYQHLKRATVAADGLLLLLLLVVLLLLVLQLFLRAH